MDRWISSWNSSSFGTFAERIPKLQTTFESWTQRAQGFAKFKALGFGLFAAAMGIIAYNTCCEETSLAWVKAHFPSQAIWQASLSAEGLELVKDPKILAKALKALPSRVETGNQVWAGKLGETSEWWAIYPGSDRGDPLIFCRNCEQIAKKWVPVGEGWASFDLVIAEIKSKASTRITKKEQRRLVAFDPREIRY